MGNQHSAVWTRRTKGGCTCSEARHLPLNAASPATGSISFYCKYKEDGEQKEDWLPSYRILVQQVGREELSVKEQAQAEAQTETLHEYLLTLTDGDLNAPVCFDSDGGLVGVGTDINGVVDGTYVQAYICANCGIDVAWSAPQESEERRGTVVAVLNQHNGRCQYRDTWGAPWRPQKKPKVERGWEYSYCATCGGGFCVANEPDQTRRAHRVSCSAGLLSVNNELEELGGWSPAQPRSKTLDKDVPCTHDFLDGAAADAAVAALEAAPLRSGGASRTRAEAEATISKEEALHFAEQEGLTLVRAQLGFYSKSRTDHGYLGVYKKKPRASASRAERRVVEFGVRIRSDGHDLHAPQTFANAEHAALWRARYLRDHISVYR